MGGDFDQDMFGTGAGVSEDERVARQRVCRQADNFVAVVVVGAEGDAFGRVGSSYTPGIGSGIRWGCLRAGGQ